MVAPSSKKSLIKICWCLRLRCKFERKEEKSIRQPRMQELTTKPSIFKKFHNPSLMLRELFSNLGFRFLGKKNSGTKEFLMPEPSFHRACYTEILATKVVRWLVIAQRGFGTSRPSPLYRGLLYIKLQSSHALTCKYWFLSSWSVHHPPQLYWPSWFPALLFSRALKA